MMRRLVDLRLLGVAVEGKGRGNAPARSIGLGVSMGSSGKGSSGKKSSRESKATIIRSKQVLYDEMRELAM